jgi:hypothetical protein
MCPDLSLRRALILLWTGAVVVIALLVGATSSRAAGCLRHCDSEYHRGRRQSGSS